MEVLAAYKVGITVLVPVFSAITCCVLVTLSLRNYLLQEELRLKKIMQVYLILSALGWYMTFCYEFHPELFAWLHVLCLLSYVLPSMFFYRIVRYLTRLGKEEQFSHLHYLLPGVLAMAMLVWSAWVPIDVQIEIVRGKARVFPEGYELYARFFTVKPLLRVVFGMVYYILTIAVLVRYYKATNGKQTRRRRTAGWVIFLMCLSIGSLLSSLLPTFMPRATLLKSFWTILAAGAMAFQHVLLSYHIIRRKYWLYTPPGNVPVKDAVTALEEVLDGKTDEETEVERKTETRTKTKTEAKTHADTETGKRTDADAETGDNSQPLSEEESKPRRRQHTGMLERSHFETYFRKEKPWLNPDCKIVDLVEVFDVNRTTISNFVNRTYGVNFSRYLNRWRIEELDRLSQLPANRDKSARSLVAQAGFDNYRTYLRAVATEREAEGKSLGEKGAEKKKGGTP